MRTSSLHIHAFYLVAVMSLGFGISDAAAQRYRYEVRGTYQSSSLSEGDVRGRTFQLAGARSLLSDRTGLGVQIGYQRVGGNSTLRTAAIRAEDWQDKHTYVADAIFFIEPLRFETESVNHRFRVVFGPSVQHRRGENAWQVWRPPAFELFPEAIEAVIEASEYDHMYQAELQGDDLPWDGPYLLLTRDRRGTELGAIAGISYGLEVGRFVMGLGMDARLYQDRYKVYSYGFSLGVKL